MATKQKTTGLSYDELLEMFPEVDNVRRELIDGELIVSPSSSTRHQDVVLRLGASLLAWCKQDGGHVYIALIDVFLSETNVVEPDVIFISPENAAQVEEQFIRGAPDLVVEVSSPSTRRLELVRKRELYERFGVPEYWFVDLDADRVEIYRLEGDHYGVPRFLGRGDVLETTEAPGFSIMVDDLLGPPPEDMD